MVRMQCSQRPDVLSGHHSMFCFARPDFPMASMGESATTGNKLCRSNVVLTLIDVAADYMVVLLRMRPASCR